MAWYAVYAVELKDAPALGPRRNPDYPHVYVGVTLRTPEARFETHLDGGQTASSKVFYHGLRLRPDLYSHKKQANGQKAARKLEGGLAAEHKEIGYTVHCKVGFFWDRFR